MKRTLGALTTRGRSFAAAGATAILCAFVLGERDLLRAGVLVLALPLLSVLSVSRTRYRLASARRLTPSRVPVGRETRVELRLDNMSRLPTGLLLVEDRVPYALGTRARFVLDRIEPHGSRELSYRVRSDLRGRYTTGPLSVRLTDPFGLVELDRSFSLADTLTVTPALVPLPRGRTTGAWAFGGESPARTVSSMGEDDIAPREYRQGDDLRRVHWRSTARYGELMVRREEQHWQSSGSLFLDTRRRAHPGEGTGSSFEEAVSVTASVGMWLHDEGLGVRLVTDTGEVLPPSRAFETALLNTLATVRTSGSRSLGPGLRAVRGSGGAARAGDGLLVAVFGRLQPAEARSVAAARRDAASCVAVLVDVPAREDPEGRPDRTGAVAQVLRAAGWQVITIASAAGLPAAWSRAGRGTGQNRPTEAGDPSGGRRRTHVEPGPDRGRS
jgi:uncharacterized protein (DUF58 family)